MLSPDPFDAIRSSRIDLAPETGFNRAGQFSLHEPEGGICNWKPPGADGRRGIRYATGNSPGNQLKAALKPVNKPTEMAAESVDMTERTVSIP